MPDFQNLLFPDAAPVSTQRMVSDKRVRMRGCDYCPQNGVRGIKKIIGAVKGKKIFVWVQSPGPGENIEGRELVGRSGQWLWRELRTVGIEREDCDIQNVMRCFPADWTGRRWKMRDPLPEELYCCSVYTDRAIATHRANIHLVFGKFASEQLFGKDFSSPGPLFWSDRLRGKVILLDHPSYFIRGTAPEDRLDKFRKLLQLAAQVSKEPPDRFGYLRTLDYRAVDTIEKGKKAVARIRELAKSRRLSLDFEDVRDKDGRARLLCAGFSGEKGVAYVFLLDHYHGVHADKETRDALWKMVKDLVDDPNIQFILHSGNHDTEACFDAMGTKIPGYDYDTRYAEYFRYPTRRSYALAEIAAVRFPRFLGYKEVVMPEAAPQGVSYERASKDHSLDFSRVPWDKLVLRCAADCDLTKRIERSTKDDVSLPLLHVYMDAAYTLDAMESNGPYWDDGQCEKLFKVYPPREAKLRRKLQLLSGDPKFNPGTPAEVAWLIYDKLKLPVLNKHKVRSTDKKVLELMLHMHEAPGLVLEFRRVVKMKSTYLVGFRRSAQKHKGRLATIWHQTRARTGRAASGAGQDKDPESGIVNLQNVHNDPQLQNALVSDLRWRDIYEAWLDRDVLGANWWKRFLDYWVFIANDHSQLEIRQLAQEAEEPLLIEQFHTGEDIHCQVGNTLTGWSLQRIAEDKATRTFVKNMHFGMVYGLQPPGMQNYLLSKGIKRSIEEVTKFMRRYFEKYRRIKPFQEAKWEQAKKYGYVENIFGFRVPVNVDEDAGDNWKSQAVNYPIQGGAHQLMTIGHAILKRMAKTYSLIRVPNMEVHDALYHSVKLRDIFEGQALVKELLEKEIVRTIRADFGIKWRVPLLSEGEAGFRLGTKIEAAKFNSIEEFLWKWCEKNKKAEADLKAEIESAAA